MPFWAQAGVKQTIFGYLLQNWYQKGKESYFYVTIKQHHLVEGVVCIYETSDKSDKHVHINHQI